MKKHSAVNWLFLCCWATYLTAYLCRVNFSSAMNTISTETGFSASHLGLIGAVFYGVYACGQLVNGYIGDRVRANRYLLLALTGTLMCNLGMAFVHQFALMMILWGINGIFQSMFWSTIIRGLAQNTVPEKRATISMGISLAMPVAYLVSWGLLGQLLAGASSKWYFLVPAVVSLVMIGAWLILSRHYSFELTEEKKNNSTIFETFRFLCEENLHWMLIVCFFHGLIKEGAAYWTPLLVIQLTGTGSISPFLLACVLPVANLIGIIASRALLGGKESNPFLVIVFVFGGICLLCGGLMMSSHGLLIVGLIALVSGLCYANNTLLMSFIPMQYTSRNMVASIIGVFDFFSYAGAAISTYVFGKILAKAGFAPLPWIWLASACAALVICALVLRQRRAR
ncbi:MAG: MFS transporter [Clostridia bacterium]|nr:MFS transporter [Clostridia bacterium]